MLFVINSYQGNGASCPESLRMFEEQLQKLSVPVEFSRAHAFVPSFMEDWVFYQVWQKQN
jgi:spermine synthase